ncbi:MAG: TVP38/TMEM64 family protein [Nocardioides sp.]
MSGRAEGPELSGHDASADSHAHGDHQARTALLKLSALLLILLGLFGLAIVAGPDLAGVKSRVHAAGIWGPAVFFAVYTLLALVPWPKAVLTAAGGMLFGMWGGALLSLGAALIGAICSFGVGRLLGRDAVDRLIHGRLRRVDALLSDHGLSAVLVVRLVPVVPYTAINYAAGLSGVSLRNYVLGSGIGMLPGSLAYAAMGAYGTNPWGLAIAGSGLIGLIAAGAWWARRLEPQRS